MPVFEREIIFDHCQYWLESKAFESDPPDFRFDDPEMFGMRLYLASNPFDAGHVDFMPEKNFRQKLRELKFGDLEIEAAIRTCRAAGPKL
jgi:hypothetical protein